MVVRNTEDDGQHTRLRFIQFQQAGQQLRTHAGDRRAHRMSLFAENIEETDRAVLELRVLDAEFRETFLNETGEFSDLADTGQVAFHIGHEARNAGLAEGLCQNLQGDRLARTGGTGDKAVAVGHLAHNTDRAVLAMGYIQPSFFI